MSKLTILLNDAKNSREKNAGFRVKAYAAAIAAIRAWPRKITSGAELRAHGVGEKICAKIDEILATGDLHQTALINDESRIKTQFVSVWGIGPVRAKQLYDAGARTIEDLAAPEYQKMLTCGQKVGLRHFEDFKLRAPREIVAKFVDQVAKIAAPLKIHPCGSFRRKESTCGDVDILICADNAQFLAQFVEKLRAADLIVETLGLGKTKFMGVSKLSNGQAFRIDIEMVPKHEFPFALLYFTGSGKFNEHQRAIAKAHGFSLSEHGLKNVATGEYIDPISAGIHTEKDIFTFLKMDYLEPGERYIVA